MGQSGHLGINADPGTVVHQCPATSVIGRWFGLTVACGRSRYHPPVVEESGQVIYLAGTFADPQQQVIVLRTVETRATATHLVDEAPAHHGQMAQVVLPPESLR